MKRINTILWSEEPPENTNTLWLNDGILYYYNDGWEAISDISKYIESLAKSADRITAASNKIFSVNNMLSNNADLIVSNVQKLESSSDSISQSTEILATVSQQLTDSAEDVINGANTIKNSADTLQESADIVKASAEQIGANIADLQASVSSIDDAVVDINQGASTIANSATKVETSATTLEGVSTIISDSATSLAESATAIAEGANTIKGSADVLQENADKVGASATAVEQAVEPLVQASESLDATKQAFEMLSSEWSDGRKAIATALTNRRYPTEPSESFHAMADKITNMSYEEGWFAKIGYTDENDGGIKELIDYSYELAKAWNPDGSTAQIFGGNTKIAFLPVLDWSNVKNAKNALAECSNLIYIPALDFSNVEVIEGAFVNTDIRELVIRNTGKVTTWGYSCFGGNNQRKLTKIDSLDWSSAPVIYSGIFNNCNLLAFLKITNLGKSTAKTFPLQPLLSWGTGGEENRQSLIDSLITYSYDRASAGMATATIQLHANTKALLTEEEIAQITNKGFTIA